MRELEQKQRLRKKIYSMPVIIILGGLTILSARGAYSVMEKEREGSREVDEMLGRVEALSVREIELLREVDRLKTESGVEEEIKSKYNVARVGERVAVIVEDKEDVATTTEDDSSWWKSFWGGILGR